MTAQETAIEVPGAENPVREYASVVLSKRLKQSILIFGFQTTAQEIANSLALRSICVRRTTNFRVSADLRCLRQF